MTSKVVIIDAQDENDDGSTEYYNVSIEEVISAPFNRILQIINVLVHVRLQLWRELDSDDIDVLVEKDMVSVMYY